MNIIERLTERIRWARIGIWACNENNSMRPSIEARGEKILYLTTEDGEWTIEISIRRTGEEPTNIVTEPRESSRDKKEDQNGFSFYVRGRE